jgi:hypothetical protein
MSSFFTKRTAIERSALLLAALGLGACTDVQVEETRVMLDTTACSSNGGNNNGGNQQPQPTSAVMDTYIVQIFELYHPESATPTDCNDCLASRLNCFLEKETCVCGDQTPVSPDTLPGMLENVRLSIPANYGSLYCMRIMAVERTSQAEEKCECDASWETTQRTRLCAVSTPYAAGPLPVQMPVQCTDNRGFASCAIEPSSTAAAASMSMN